MPLLRSCHALQFPSALINQEFNLGVLKAVESGRLADLRTMFFPSFNAACVSTAGMGKGITFYEASTVSVHY